MKHNIKLVAVDIDGTFVRSDYTYDAECFKRILSVMKEAGCGFVVASGNQYYQLRDLYRLFCERLKGKAEPTTSGHGSIDLIVPGCHKASGLKRLVERWGISPAQCAAFGDGGE